MSDSERDVVLADSDPNIEITGEGNEEEENLKFDFDVQEVSSCERHIKVTIPREEVDRYLEKEYAEIHKTVAVPGFRIGKAPRRMIEKKFKEDVVGRVKTNLLLETLTKINEDQSITPISEPDLNFRAINLPESGPFVYEYNIEVRPEFDLPNWKGLKLERPVREFTDTDVDMAIERIRKNYGQLADSDEPAKPGDYIWCKLSFIHDGAVISSSESEVLRIGPVLTFHDSAIKNFDKLMTGAKAGDTVSTKTILSVDTPNAFLSGKEVDAVFDIKKVRKMELPEINEAFVQNLGGFDTIADFRDFILDLLDRQLRHEQRQRARTMITEKLTEGADWTLPPSLLDRQARRELQRAYMEMRRNGFDDNQIMNRLNRLRQDIKATTAKALKEHFILERIAELESIEDMPADYDNEIALMAAQSGESPRRVRAQIEKAGEMDILRNQIIEQKVLTLIESEATFVEVPFDLDLRDEEEAVDMAAGSDKEESDIPEVSEEEAKEVARTEAEKGLKK